MTRPATINMPKKEKAPEPDVPRAGQARPAMARYRLQVDRQTKATFASLEDAQRAGQAIKKSFPVVQVSIYDAEQSTQASLD
ncbi:MAG TPA: hypothetical protein VNR39_18780 [Pseudolabrys sp.]|nr:hypothetical protein [Pseudolabrys sp.]